MNNEIVGLFLLEVLGIPIWAMVGMLVAFIAAMNAVIHTVRAIRP